MTDGQFLSAGQSDLLAAICDRIFPSSPDGPGASDVHVVQYVDRQLASPWGKGARMYRQSPFLQPRHRGHGWQSPMTPAEAYTYGLSAIEEWAQARFREHFTELSTGTQDSIIEDLSAGRIDTFKDLSGVDFFMMIRKNIVEALFCDPSYGGNHQMAGWRWVGYPGVASAHRDDYAQQMDQYGQPYSAEPLPLD